MRRSSQLARQSLCQSSLRYSFNGRRQVSTSKSDSKELDKRLTSILIANRGEIALRVGRTASQGGIRTTVIYTDPDARSQHALSSPYAINLGQPSAYLDADKIIAAAKDNGCVGMHPGYGFLSENSAFAKKCVESGLIFIGPPWEAMEAMGNKSRSKEIMTGAGVPCIPGYHGPNQDPDFLKAEAEKIGFPVLLKAVKGGGGKGMRIAMTPEEFNDQLQSAKSEAMSSFGDDVMLVEKYITTPRHIEVQVFADKHGNAVALGERDCSIQRRHQKIIEESPAPNLDETTRQDLWEKARAAALAVKYEGAGTVEFIFDNDTGQFFFMEMNTRLQVEHPVTEMVTGEDLVQWQISIAEGAKIPLSQTQIEQRIAERGHAIEARIYAENPEMNFVPDSGRLLYMQTPVISDTVRIDSGFAAGDEVSAHYDPMIAKLIVQGPNRDVAIQKLHAALEEYRIAGLVTNIDFIKRVCQSKFFLAGDVETGFIPKHKEELFTPQPIPNEVFVQAALALMFSDATGLAKSWTTQAITQPGFGTSKPQQRSFSFAQSKPDSTPDLDAGSKVTVNIHSSSSGPPGLFDITVTRGDRTPSTFPSVAAQWNGGKAPTKSASTITSFFPHTRLESVVVRTSEDAVSSSTGPDLSIFQQGSHHRLHILPPAWIAKVTGLSAAGTAHSVLAPMPCKILRVEAAAGQSVMKDQPLVVIESMKMETTIRSPQNGVVKRVVHAPGDICKAGTALVEFDDAEGEAS